MDKKDKLLDGIKLSEELLFEIKTESNSLTEKTGIVPGLALLLVGNNPASEVYVANKAKACEQIGFHSIIKRMDDTTPEEEIIKQILIWNEDPTLHGILVQLPLPKHIHEFAVIQSIIPEKDVDGFHPESAGRLMIGLPGFVSCTPAGILEIIERYQIPTKGKHTVVVGRSNIVGKPIANLMLQKSYPGNSTVTVCHTGSDDMSLYTKQADILIVAVGVPQMIKAKDVKEGVVIIDVGINRIPDSSKKSGSRLVGDVDFDSVYEKASKITPVPGGVGKMTIAMLMKNTLLSAQRFAEKL